MKCKPYLSYMKINANDQLDLRGTCISGCNTNDKLTYSYDLYMLNTSSNQWVLFEENNSYSSLTGKTKSDLIISKNLFTNFSMQIIWKITLILFDESQQKNGTSSLIVYVNQPPGSGSCKIFPLNGTTNTLFNILCVDWIDPIDGIVVNYVFYGKKFIFS